MGNEIYEALVSLERETMIAKGLAELWDHIDSDVYEFGKLLAIEAFIEGLEQRAQDLKALVETQKGYYPHVAITVKEEASE